METIERVDDGPRRMPRQLSVWEAIGVSLALMAPSMAANINPQASATTVGRAVPLAFALAAVGVLLVSYTFVRLCQRFNHSGSVYGFVGATLGARAGVVSGWALTGTYIFFGVVTSMAGGRFLAALLNTIGVWNNPPVWSGFLLGAIGMVLVWWLATTPVRAGTRVVLFVEAVTVLLILAVTATIVYKLATHTAPGGRRIDWSVFTIPHGIGTSTLFLGVVFGFLSFAGFEAASTLGEEAREPRRDIPRAILGVAIFGGCYFVIVTAVEVMGFGTTAKGVHAFISSGSLLGTLGTSYLASWVGTLITVGAMISAFSCALASAIGASRLAYALGRDRVMFPWLGHISPLRRTPTHAAAGVLLAMYFIVAITWFVLGGTPFELFAESGTIGTLILLVVYILAGIGMIKLVFFSGDRSVGRWQIVIPLAGLVVLGYTIYRNIYPLPTGIAWWGPTVALAWLLAGVIGILARPAIAARAGRRLAESEGLLGPREEAVTAPAEAQPVAGV
jgi:amino acid transporter